MSVSRVAAAAAASAVTTSSNLTPEQAIEFVAGMIYGFIEKDDLKELETCIQNADQLADEVSEAIADFEKADLTDIIAGVELVGKVIQELPTDVQNCENVKDDVARLEKYAEIFQDPTKLAETVTVNFFKHAKIISADASDISVETGKGDFYKAGDDVADLVVQVLGPVPEDKDNLFIF